MPCQDAETTSHSEDGCASASMHHMLDALANNQHLQSIQQLGHQLPQILQWKMQLYPLTPV